MTPQDSPQSANTPRSRVGKVGTRRRMTQVAAGDLTGLPPGTHDEELVSSPAPPRRGQAPSSAHSRWTQGSVSRSIVADSPARPASSRKETRELPEEGMPSGGVPPLPASPEGEEENDDEEEGEYDSSSETSVEDVQQENVDDDEDEVNGEEDSEDGEEEDDGDDDEFEEEEEESEEEEEDEEVSEVKSATPAAPRRRPTRQAAQLARRHLTEAPSPTPMRPTRRRAAAARDDDEETNARTGGEESDDIDEVDSDDDGAKRTRARQSKYAARGTSRGKRVGPNKRSLRSSTRHNRASEIEPSSSSPKQAGRRTKRAAETEASADDVPIAARVRRSRRGTKA